MSETFVAPVFRPPHQPPVFRVLKQRWREYLKSGSAIGFDIDPCADQLAGVSTVVSGFYYADKTVPRNPIVSVNLQQGATIRATRTVTPNPDTGAWTTTFPANTMQIGTAFANVYASTAAGTARNATFNVT